jgi:hypothetical protein
MFDEITGCPSCAYCARLTPLLVALANNNGGPHDGVVPESVIDEAMLLFEQYRHAGHGPAVEARVRLGEPAAVREPAAGSPLQFEAADVQIDLKVTNGAGGLVSLTGRVSRKSGAALHSHIWLLRPVPAQLAARTQTNLAGQFLLDYVPTPGLVLRIVSDTAQGPIDVRLDPIADQTE